MSYLLTEIALEMLGYKYYDVFGVQDEINNFQKISNGDRNAHGSKEPNLAVLLGLCPGASSSDLKESKRSVSKSVAEEAALEVPSGLTKIMDAEYGKLKHQVIRNKPTQLATDGQLDGRTVKMLANNFLGNEREKLHVEKQNLKSFRRHIEQVLIQINPNTFEKYCESFKDQPKSTKRSIQGATKI